MQKLFRDTIGDGLATNDSSIIPSRLTVDADNATTDSNQNPVTGALLIDETAQTLNFAVGDQWRTLYGAQAIFASTTSGVSGLTSISPLNPVILWSRVGDTVVGSVTFGAVLNNQSQANTISLSIPVPAGNASPGGGTVNALTILPAGIGYAGTAIAQGSIVNLAISAVTATSSAFISAIFQYQVG